MEVPSGEASVGCQEGSAGALPGRLCPFLLLMPAPVSLPSLRCLGPLQLHHCPPSEHRGRRVDDVSGRWGWGRVGSGRCAGLLLLRTLPRSVFLVLCRARPGAHPPRHLLGLGLGSPTCHPRDPPSVHGAGSVSTTLGLAPGSSGGPQGWLEAWHPVGLEPGAGIRSPSAGRASHGQGGVRAGAGSGGQSTLDEFSAPLLPG